MDHVAKLPLAPFFTQLLQPGSALRQDFLLLMFLKETTSNAASAKWEIALFLTDTWRLDKAREHTSTGAELRISYPVLLTGFIH